MAEQGKDALSRILAQLDPDDLLNSLTRKLSPSDLSTLLLALYRDAAKRTTPSELLKRYEGNRYTVPSQFSAFRIKQLELELLELSEAHGYESVQLSPVSPLGCCSAVATVNQDKVVSAVRNLEATADPTNALVLELCQRIRNCKNNAEDGFIRLCTTHRVVRAQPFHKPGQVNHFSILCLVTGGIDTGSYGFEKKALEEHVRLYTQIFTKRFGQAPVIRLRDMPGYTDGEGLIGRLTEHLSMQIPHISVVRHPEAGDNNYYKGMQYSVIIKPNEAAAINIGDGGFVDWSQKLLNNSKQRVLISAIGIDRLLMIL